MELLEPCRWYLAWRCRWYNIPRLVFSLSQRMGNGGGHTLPLRHAFQLCGVNRVSCPVSPLYMERAAAKVDHAAIYWHIAGSYSPITLVALRDQGLWGWALFCFVWLCAIVGTIISFQHLKGHSNVETFAYVGMGLCVLVAFKPLIDSVSPSAVAWIVAEGVAYITGALFYIQHKRKYMHTVFHFFVLLGSVCHIIAVWSILLQYV